MPLYREDGMVADPWLRLADDATVPVDGPVLVSFARWRAARPALLARRGPVGVALANTDEVEELASDVARLDLIALSFPKYTDGRAYSQARLLRERYGYRGELRATGQVLRDQFVFMSRAGFDAFEVKKDADADAFAETVKRYSVFNQPTGDGRVTALNRRMQLRHSESAGQ